MAWTTARTWVAFELVTAAMGNTHWRDNLNELRGGGIAMASQAALDFVFATSATQFGRIPTGLGNQAIRINSGATAYEFYTPVDTAGLMPVAGQTALDFLYALNSTTLARVPKGTANQVIRMNSGATGYEFATPTDTGLQPAPSQTALDFLYASSSTALGRIAKGTGLQYLRVNSGSTGYEFATLPAAPTFIAPRVTTLSSSATPTPNADTTDSYTLSAQAQSATFGAPTGTPVNTQRLLVRIKDNGTARTLAWNTAYIQGGVALPTTTTINKILHLMFIYNTDNSLNKWVLVASALES